MRDQAGEKGETAEARAEAGTVEATVRRRSEEKERKKQRPSSEMLKLKADERKRKRGESPEEKRTRGSGKEGKHRCQRLWERNREG